MQTESETFERPTPICSILSLAAPFAGVTLAFLGDRLFRILHPNDQGWLSGVAFVVLPIFGALITGTLLAGVAAMREEKWTVLRWVALFLNAGPLVIAIIASSL